MTDVIEDAATPWTPPAGPVALSEAKIAEIKALAQKADQLVEASLSENTRIAYGKAWRAWCLGFGLDPTGGGACLCRSGSGGHGRRALADHAPDRPLGEALAIDHPAAARRGGGDPQAAEAAAAARRR
jgi:hypothetical protein